MIHGGVKAPILKLITMKKRIKIKECVFSTKQKTQTDNRILVQTNYSKSDKAKTALLAMFF